MCCEPHMVQRLKFKIRQLGAINHFVLSSANSKGMDCLLINYIETKQRNYILEARARGIECCSSQHS